jgi:threonine dehydratase
VLTIDAIEQAALALKPKLRQTPLEYSPALSQILGVPVYLKLEFLQVTGSFKYRGALYAVSRLSPEKKQRGIAACSAGNHGIALAYASAQAGIPCTVFVPKNVDEVKFNKLLSLGAKVERSSFIGYDETSQWSKAIIKQRNLHEVSPFDDDEIMIANGGTLAVEILKDLPDARHFLFPVGGGGLAAGFSFYAKQKNPHCTLIGCQHEGSPALKLSLERGKAVTTLPPFDTLAAPIEGGLGARCFPYLKDRIAHVALVSEHEIFQAFRWMLSEHQYLIEPASTVPIAACLKGDLPALSGPAVLILTGRNVSLETIKKMLAL